MSRLLFISLLLFSLAHSQPNPPHNLKATCSNNYVLLQWDVPLPGASFDTYAIYVNGGYLTSIPSLAGTKYKDDNSGLHVKRTYTVKATHSEFGTASIHSNSTDGYGIRCFYVSNNGSGSQTGLHPDHAVPLSSVNGNNFLIYPFVSGGTGFYAGDTVFLVNTFNQNITLPSSSAFPKTVVGMTSDTERRFVLCGAQVYHGANYQPILSGDGTSTGDAITSNGADYISFAYLRFTNINQFSSAIVFNHSSYSTINNCYFDFNSGSHCIKMQGADGECINNIIENNIVLQTTGSDCWGSTGDEAGDGDFIQMGRQADINTGTFSGHIIRYNDVTMQNSKGSLPEPPHTDCVQIYRVRKDDHLVIHNNIFRWKGSRDDGNTQGIYATSLLAINPGGVIDIYNNIFYMATTGKNMCAANNYIQTETEPRPVYHTSYIVLRIWNNTFYAELNWNMIPNEKIIWVNRVPTEGEIVPPLPSGSKSFELINNVFANFSSPQPSKLSVLSLNDEAGFEAQNVTIDDNLYYCPSFNIDPEYITYYKDGSLQDYTFDQFKAATIHEAEGHGGTISFYNPSFPPITDNPISFRADGTYVVDHATTLSSLFTTYFNGYNRLPNYWDRGAWEFIYTTPPDDSTGAEVGKIVVEGSNIPDEFGVSKNYPNPFNPTTNINYAIPRDGTVQIRLFNLTGQEISNYSKSRSAGYYTHSFDLSSFPSGIYFYSIWFDGQVYNNKMILVK